MNRAHQDVMRVIVHRMRAHQAALSTAAALGYPAILAAQVSATRAALAENVAILEALTSPVENPAAPVENPAAQAYADAYDRRHGAWWDG